MTLNEFFAAHPKCALGFSGGVDSAYLLYAGVRAGRISAPTTSRPPSSPGLSRTTPSGWPGSWG